MNDPIRSIDTKLIHVGEPRILGAVAMPIFQSATFDATGQASYHDARYIRLNNTPNHTALNTKLAALEGGEAAIVTASGMAAITTTLLTVLATGDRVLAQRGVYGGTHGFLTQELRGVRHRCRLDRCDRSKRLGTRLRTAHARDLRRSDDESAT
jgi:cystathionine gamma-synthase/cystathionine gamma-lyase/cystathionine beta-lyase